MTNEFIGRHQELKKFEAALDTFADDKPHFAYVYDAAEKIEDKGGIGKTRLLYEFLRIAKSPKYENKFLVIDEIFDFYEPINRDRLTRISHFIRFLEEKAQTKAFDKFWKNIREYYSQKVSMEKVIQEYFAGYNHFCQETGKKIIRFYDTFEVVEKTLNYVQAPYRFIGDPILLDSFVVISGRYKPDIRVPLWEGRQSQILEFPLQGFSDEEAQEYFACVGYQDLNPQHIVDLNKKAKGRPILLALIVDYLNNILKIEDILKLDEKDFKERLVAFINEFENPPIDQAILAMAHLKHYCDAKFLRQVVKTDENFDKVYDLLKSLSFVRPLGVKGDYIVLHDEMQKMVSAFILDKVYSDGSLRREISERAVALYSEEIKTLREKEDDFKERKDVASLQIVRDERFMLKAEQWYHKVYVSRAENLDYYFYELYDPSVEAGQLDYCFILHGHLDDLSQLLDLSERSQSRIKMRLARLNSEKYLFTSNRYYYDLAKELFDELIEDAKKRSVSIYLGTLLCDYGTLYFYDRQLDDAEKMLRDSVKTLENETENVGHDLLYYLGKAKNWLGYILYNQGRFRESTKVLEEAEKHLSEADNLVKNDPEIADSLKKLRREQIDAWIAQVRGNLCRIYREVGEAEKSIDYGESSLFRRRRLENLKEIVKGLNSLGLIYARTGEIDKALELYEEAEGHLQNVPDPILEGRILTNKATLLFKRDQFSDLLAKHTRKSLPTAKRILGANKAKINKARELLNRVIPSLMRTNARELATAHHNLGELNLMEGKYDEAIENFENAVKVAERSKDAYTLLNSRQRLVLGAYLKNDTTLFHELAEKFSSAQQELKDPEETARYVVRYYITFGNFYYDELFNGKEIEDFDKNFSHAFQSYTDAVVYAHNHAKGSIKFSQEIFAERIRELLKVKEISQNLRDELLTYWQEQKLDTAELQRYLDF